MLATPSCTRETCFALVAGLTPVSLFSPPEGSTDISPTVHRVYSNFGVARTEEGFQLIGPASGSQEEKKVPQKPAGAEGAREAKEECISSPQPPAPSKRASRMRGGEQDQVSPLKQENDAGKIEYKWKLVGKSADRITHLITQLNYRLTEGKGEAIYELGILDDGTPQGLSDEDLAESIATLKHMAAQLKCDVVVVRIATGLKGKVAEVLVRKLSYKEPIEVRICVLGNVDSGKSTLVGVLTSGQLDNGRGLARMNVFRHRHEVENGRTSAISRQIIGFDGAGNITNTAPGLRRRGWAEIMEESSKIVTFLDLAGHENYLKTTLFGLIGGVPDYALIAIAANNGMTGTAREHLGLAVALQLPTFIVITKIDICPEHVLNQTIDEIVTALKAKDVNKSPVVVRSSHEVLPLLTNKRLTATAQSLCPIFLVSSVDGRGLKALKVFLHLLPKQKDWTKEIDQPCEFSIDDYFTVEGVGTVVTGMMLKGSISMGDQRLLGPDSNGNYSLVTVKSIHVNRTAKQRAVAGQAASLALKKVKRTQIRKGMVLVDPSLKPKACIGFEARIQVLSRRTTLKPGYEPVVHCGNVRQSAKVVFSDPEQISTGQRGVVRFAFLYRPEHLDPHARFIFREGRTKGAGRVTRLLFYPDDVPVLGEGWAFRTPANATVKTARISVRPSEAKKQQQHVGGSGRISPGKLEQKGAGSSIFGGGGSSSIIVNFTPAPDVEFAAGAGAGVAESAVDGKDGSSTARSLSSRSSASSDEEDEGSAAATPTVEEQETDLSTSEDDDLDSDDDEEEEDDEDDEEISLFGGGSSSSKAAAPRQQQPQPPERIVLPSTARAAALRRTRSSGSKSPSPFIIPSPSTVGRRPSFAGVMGAFKDAHGMLAPPPLSLDDAAASLSISVSPASSAPSSAEPSPSAAVATSALGPPSLILNSPAVSPAIVPVPASSAADLPVLSISLPTSPNASPTEASTANANMQRSASAPVSPATPGTVSAEASSVLASLPADNPLVAAVLARPEEVKLQPAKTITHFSRRERRAIQKQEKQTGKSNPQYEQPERPDRPSVGSSTFNARARARDNSRSSSPAEELNEAPARVETAEETQRRLRKLSSAIDDDEDEEELEDDDEGNLFG